MSFAGAVIGALAGVCAVLIFRLTQRPKDGGEKNGNGGDTVTDEKPKRPVEIEYRFGSDRNETDNSEQ